MTKYNAKHSLMLSKKRDFICAKPVSKCALLRDVVEGVGDVVLGTRIGFLGDVWWAVAGFAVVVAFAAAVAAGLSGVDRAGRGVLSGGVFGGCGIVSKGLVYTETGRLGVGERTGGSGAGVAGGFPIFEPPPLRIHGQRSVSVRFCGVQSVSCVLLVVAFGFSSSLELELECELWAPADVPRGSLTLYPKIESPSTEYWRVKFGMVLVGLGERDFAFVAARGGW